MIVESINGVSGYHQEFENIVSYIKPNIALITTIINIDTLFLSFIFILFNKLFL